MQEVINTGATADDGTGDTLRAGATKVNSNFTQLFSYLNKPVSGRWYSTTSPDVTLAAGTNLSTNVLLYPFIIQETTQISELGIRITTGATGGLASVAIYANGTTQEPLGAPLVTLTGLSAAAAGTPSGAASVTLQPGIYWAAYQTNNATVAAQFFASTTQGLLANVSGATTLAGITTGANTGIISRAIVNTYGSFPTLTAGATATTGAARGAILYYRVA